MCNSAEVMSEEMADHLQQEEARVQKKEAAGGAGVVPSVDTSEDLTIAHLLQKQFGSEAVTFARYRLDSEHLPDNGSSEEEEDYFSEDDWESYETRESGVDGVKKNGENVVSKHDKELSQRKNAKRIMEFPTGLEMGDTGGGAQVRYRTWRLILISSPRHHHRSRSATRYTTRCARLMDKEDKATTEKALDPKTLLLIYKLVNGVISMGKEAVIFHAHGGPGPQDCHRPKPYKVPKECVLKVFKTTLNEFKTRDKYIRVRITTFFKSHLINQPKVSLTHFLISGRLQVPQKIN